jgi:SAM-dependent methyltransferase
MNKLYNQKVLNFWKEKGENFLFPQVNESIREAKFSRKFFRKIVNGESIIEIGCGNGRIAQGFASTQYKGYDVNPTVIAEAKKSFPDFSFNLYTPFDTIPSSDWVIVHTVLLHIADEDINKFLDVITLNSKNIIISEIMSREFRGDEDSVPPVFNRDTDEYIKMMLDKNFSLMEENSFYFDRYETDMNYLVFSKKPFS